MVDIHSHILFGVDDGADNLDKAIEMAKEAYKGGFTKICCTPHYLEPNFICSPNENLEKLKCFQDKLKQEFINLEVNLGNEVLVTEETINDFNLEKFITLNSSKYILLELPMINELKGLDKILSELLLLGKKVIIAHPERYKYIQENIEYVIPYLEKGILFQGNFGSINGRYGESAKKCIINLLKKEYIQVLATDAHKPKSIYYNIETINKKLKSKISEKYFEELTVKNPSKILNNDDIEIKKIQKKKKFIFSK